MDNHEDNSENINNISETEKPQNGQTEELFQNESEISDTVDATQELFDETMTPSRFQAAFEPFYNYFYVLGLQSYRYSKRYLTKFGRLLLHPLKYIAALFRLFILGLDRVFLQSLHSAREEAQSLKEEAYDSLKYLGRALKENPLSSPSIIWHYIRKGLKDHKQMFVTFLNFGLPVAAFAILFATYSFWNTLTYSVSLNFAPNNVAYVQNEGVYTKAKSMANEKLGSVGKPEYTVEQNLTDGETKNGNSSASNAPTMGLALVKLNNLSDENNLYDSLLEDNKGDLVNACGVFVDGKFIGAVKNETDATGVFESILKPYKTNEPGVFVSFIEKVDLSQGLYPKSSKLLDAKELKDILTGRKEEASYYTANAKDSCWSIAFKHGISESKLMALNPERTNIIVHEGDVFKVSSEVNFLRVKVVKTEVRKVEIDFEIEKIDNPNLFKGSSKIIKAGEKGEELVTELVSYIDGIRVSADVIDRVRTKDPKVQKVSVGTKPTTVYSSGGSYNVQVSKEGWVWPVPGLSIISSPYGYRGRGFHNGVDISGRGNANGKVIVAAKDGVVESAGYQGSWGNLVVINHGGGVKSGYAHCMNGSISVSPGQRVSAGQAIARVGSTGNSTGPHLHFFVTVNGKYVNPLPYIR